MSWPADKIFFKAFSVQELQLTVFQLLPLVSTEGKWDVWSMTFLILSNFLLFLNTFQSLHPFHTNLECSNVLSFRIVFALIKGSCGTNWILGNAGDGMWSRGLLHSTCAWSSVVSSASRSSWPIYASQGTVEALSWMSGGVLTPGSYSYTLYQLCLQGPKRQGCC